MLSGIQAWDFSVLDAIQRSRTPLGDMIMPWISALANEGLLWIALTVLLFIFGPYRASGDGKRQVSVSLRAGLSMSLALLAEGVVVNLLLKNIFRRPRPCDLAPIANMLVNRPMSWSMPSGHTAVSFAAAAALFTLNRKWGVAAFALAGLIGYTRLYLYVHFPTDVLVGAICGTVLGLAGAKLAQYVTKGGAHA